MRTGGLGVGSTVRGVCVRGPARIQITRDWVQVGRDTKDAS